MLEAANPQELLAMYRGPGTNNTSPSTGETARDIPNTTPQITGEKPDDTLSQGLVWHSIWDIDD